MTRARAAKAWGAQAAALVFLALGASAGQGEAGGTVAGTTPASFHDFSARRLGGGVEALSQYRGQVLLVVNTASQCGLTPQYAGLQALYSEYRARGFTVLGFPSNDFLEQEPGSDAEIQKFCRANYGVEFPMFSKVVVRGPDQHPVYAHLTSQPAPIGGDVEWNFQKYLVDPHGDVVARFPPRTAPDDPSLLRRIDALLASSEPGDAAKAGP